METEILKTWIEEALKLSPGEELFLQAETKGERTQLLRDFQKVLRTMSHVVSSEASRLVFLPYFKDKKFYVRLYKKAQSPLVGFKKVDGEVTKVTLEDLSPRRRQINLMIRDGYAVDEVDKLLESPLTSEERRLFEDE